MDRPHLVHCICARRTTGRLWKVTFSFIVSPRLFFFFVLGAPFWSFLVTRHFVSCTLYILTCVWFLAPAPDFAPAVPGYFVQVRAARVVQHHLLFGASPGQAGGRVVAASKGNSLQRWASVSALG